MESPQISSQVLNDFQAKVKPICRISFNFGLCIRFILVIGLELMFSWVWHHFMRIKAGLYGLVRMFYSQVG